MSTSIDPERQTFTLPQACNMVGIGQTMARQKIREGNWPVLRVGRRLLITKATIEAILSGKIDLNAPPTDRHDLPLAQK